MLFLLKLGRSSTEYCTGERVSIDSLSRIPRNIRRSFACAVLLASSVAHSNTTLAQACGVTLAPDERTVVIDEALRALDAAYVIPELAALMGDSIRVRDRCGQYDSILDPYAFASALTRDLRSVSHDLHLGIGYSENVVQPPPAPNVPPPSSPAPVSLDDAKRVGFARVEKLAGNVGYLDLRGFIQRPELEAAAASVMTYLSSTDAVIIDLRQNGGGAPPAVELIASYLVGEEPVLLFDFYDRDGNLLSSSYTQRELAGPRLVNQDVYLLTGERTFSGAESLAYALQALQRVTVVGERTPGGSHLVQVKPLTDHFLIAVPFAQPISPVTKTNWEGTGVQPDVAVPADSALLSAHELAVRELGRVVSADQLGLPGGERLLRAKTPAAPATPAADFHGDFETGDLGSWTSVGLGTGDWFVYSDGRVPPDPTQTDLGHPFDMPAPPDGRFAAVTDMAGPGILVLYQDIALDGPYLLHAAVFYDSEASLASPSTLATTEGKNQQYRIDLLEPTAPIESVAKPELLANVFGTAACDPQRLEPTPVSLDLTPWSGRTVRLRLAVANTASVLRAGADNIWLEAL